jgi:hypothetical protein
LILFIFNSFTLDGKGGYKLMFFFSPSFDMWKEEGKWVSFFFKIFFSLLNGYGGGGQGFFLCICWRGMG